MRKHKQKQTQTTAILRRCSLLFIVSIILLGSCTKYTPSGPVVSTVRDTIYTPPLPAVQMGDINPNYSGNVADYFKTPRVLYSMSGSSWVQNLNPLTGEFRNGEDEFRKEQMKWYIEQRPGRGYDRYGTFVSYRDHMMRYIYHMTGGYPWRSSWNTALIEYWGSWEKYMEYLRRIYGLPAYTKGLHEGHLEQVENGSIVLRQEFDDDPWFPVNKIGEPLGNFWGYRKWYFTPQEVSGNQMKVQADSAQDNTGWVGEPRGNFRRLGISYFSMLDNWKDCRLIVENDSLAFLLVMHPRHANTSEPWKHSHEVIVVLPNPYPKKPD